MRIGKDRLLIFVFLMFIFLTSCAPKYAATPAAPTYAIVEQPVSPSPILTLIPPVLTKTPDTPAPTATLLQPFLIKGLPEGVKVTQREFPIRFDDGFHFSNDNHYIGYIVKGPYLGYVVEGPLSPEKNPTIEFWAISIETKEKEKLFTCESCPYWMRQEVTYNQNEKKIYFEAGMYGNTEPITLQAVIDLSAKTAFFTEIDLSLVPQDSPYNYFTFQPASLTTDDLLRGETISPGGNWHVFGVAATVAHLPGLRDRAHSLFIHSMKDDTWWTLTMGVRIANLVWISQDELYIEVMEESCGGEISAYLISMEDTSIRKMTPFLCEFSKPSARVLGKFPNGNNLVIGWDYYDSRLDPALMSLEQVSICPAETLHTFDTSQCKLLIDSLDRKFQGGYPLWITAQGIMMDRWTPQGTSHMALLDTDGKLRYLGVLKGYYPYDGFALNKILLIVGDTLTYVELEDVSKFSNFQVRIENLYTAYWMLAPE